MLREVSLTRVQDVYGQDLVCIYRETDGSFHGHGTELAKFLCEVLDINFTNNYRLAAQIVNHFGDNVSLYPPQIRDVGQRYEYIVRVQESTRYGTFLRFSAKTTYSDHEYLGDNPRSFIDWAEHMRGE